MRAYRLAILAIPTLCLSSGFLCGSARAATLSIDFQGNCPTPMSFFEEAGIPLEESGRTDTFVSEWNNAPGTEGTLSGLYGSDHVLYSEVTVAWSCGGGTWALANTADTDGNNRMMKGYLDCYASPNATTVTVSGLKSLMESYLVYVFFDGDNGGTWRPYSYTIEGSAEGTQTGEDSENTDFASTLAGQNPNGLFQRPIPGGTGNVFFQNPSVPNNGEGNYFFFSGLSSDSFTLIASNAFRSPVNGLMIVDNSGNETYSPGGAGIYATQSVTGQVTMSGGGAVILDLSDVTTVNSGTNDLLDILGDLNLSGVTPMTINFPQNAAATGTYTLIRYAGNLMGGAANFSLAVPASRCLMELGQAGTSIVLNVSGTPPVDLTWVGDGIENRWNVNGSVNWDRGGSPDVFYQFDRVTFNDISGNKDIMVDEAVFPGSVLIETEGTYRFLGTSGIQGAARVTKKGAGTWSVEQPNTFSGGLTIDGGTVALLGAQTANRLPAQSTVTVNNGGRLSFRDVNPVPTWANAINVVVNTGGVVDTAPAADGFHMHLNTITMNGGRIETAATNPYDGEDFQINGSVIVAGTNASVLSLANGMSLNGTRPFDVADVTGDAAPDLLVQGELESNDQGGGAVVKLGAGTMLLESDCTYAAGTTVSQGTLRVDGSLSTGTVTVVSGATLGGTGSIAGVVNVDGRIAPGASAGAMSLGSNLTLGASASYDVELAGPASYDRLSVAGAATLGGTLNVGFLNGYETTIAPGAVFTVLTASSLSGAFANASNGASVVASGVTLQVEYGPGAADPNSVVLRAPASTPDSDGDGIDDAWELAYFGGLNLANQTSNHDTDPQSDLEEFIADTVPTNGLSYFRIEEVASAPGGTAMSWLSVSGRLYGVESTTDLVAGAWSAVATNLPALPPANSYTNPAGPPYEFYRIRVRRDVP